MSRGFAVATLVLLIVAALGAALDFVLSEDEHRRVKDRLADWYVAIADSKDWSFLVISAARVTEGLMRRWFGDGFFSWKYAILVLGLNASVSYAVLRHFPHVFFWGMLTRTVFVNSIVDVIAFGVGRAILRAIVASRTKSKATRGILLLSIVTYIAIGVDFGLPIQWTHGVVFGFRSWLAGLYLWPEYLLYPYGWTDGFDLMFGLSGLSGLCFLLILTATLVVVAMRPILQGPLSITLERLAMTPKGAIAGLTGTIAIIVGIIGAARDVIAK